MRELPHIIQDQIEKTIGDNARRIEELTAKVSFANLNSRTALDSVFAHEQALNVHGIEENILNIINENMLLNAGLELDEAQAGFPDDWDLVSELGSSNYDVFLDDTHYKYGTKSLKIQAINPGSTGAKVYIQQRVDGVLQGGGIYTFSFFHLDNGSQDYKPYAEIYCYDDQSVLIDVITFNPSRSSDTENVGQIGTSLRTAMLRFWETFQMPNGTNHVYVNIGIEVFPNVSNYVECWIDYPTFHPGFAPFRPSELIEGILKTKHISTEGLDAKVIKTGIIKITDQLSLETEAGDVKLRYDQVAGGNVLEFFDDINRLIAIGKYGPNALDVGLEITNSDGSQYIRANATGIQITGSLTATSITADNGIIAGFNISNNAITSPGNRIILDSSAHSIVVNDGSVDQVIIGKYSSSPEKWGIAINRGNINLGNGAFVVDETGSMVATLGNIAGFTISPTIMSSPGDILQFDSANKVIRITNGSTTLVSIGQYQAGVYGVDIKNGQINLGNGKFVATSAGEITALAGTIANFSITQNDLRSTNNQLILDGDNATVTLSDDVEYATIFKPGGVYGKVPIAQVSQSKFDHTQGGNDYYIVISDVNDGISSYNENEDFLYNKITGEIVKRKGSSMPSTVNVVYTVYDDRDGDGIVSTSNETDQLTFVPTTRASALISDDSLIDATFIKNLIVGAAELGIAVINTAHVNEIHGSKITSKSIDTEQLAAGAVTLTELDFTPLISASGANDIIATINASNEDGGTLRIQGNKIHITGETTFASSDLDPTTKETPSGAQAKANAAESNAKNYADANFLDRATYLIPGQTTIDGGKIHTNTVLLDSLAFVPLTSAGEANEIIATINASLEDDGSGGSLRIQGSKIHITGETTFASADYSATPFLDKGTYLTSGQTTIDGGKITTNTITLNHLNFTPLKSLGSNAEDIIGTINASQNDGLFIKSSRIKIDGSVVFASGYDPTTKIPVGGAASDINNNTTLINGGKIQTNSIDANRLKIGSVLNADESTGVIITNLNASRISTGILEIGDGTSKAKLSIVGTNGHIEATGNGIWAYNSSGQAQAGFDITGKWIAGGGKILADATGLRVYETSVPANQNSDTLFFQINATNNSVFVRGSFEAGELILPIEP